MKAITGAEFSKFIEDQLDSLNAVADRCHYNLLFDINCADDDVIDVDNLKEVGLDVSLELQQDDLELPDIIVKTTYNDEESGFVFDADIHFPVLSTLTSDFVDHVPYVLKTWNQNVGTLILHLLKASITYADVEDYFDLYDEYND